jgi:uncharacterized BrkB/YihY/UPF0761 family membrane protein
MTIRIIWSLAALVVSALVLAIGLVIILKSNSLSSDLKGRFLGQICSGRWVLTVMAGICLLLLTMAHIWKGEQYSIGGAAIVAIISTVFSNYFNKQRTNGNGYNKPKGPQGPAE